MGTKGIVAGLALVCLVWAAPPARAQTPAPRVQVPDSPLGRALAPRLAAELGAERVVRAPTPAELLVELSEADGALRLVVRDLDGTLVLDRRVTSGPARAAAWRKVVFAIERAARPPAVGPVPPPTTAPPPPEPAASSTAAAPRPPPEAEASTGPRPAPPRFGGGRLRVGLGPHLTWAAGAPQIGVEGLAAWRLGPLRVGVRGAWAGLCCAGRSEADGGQTALEGDPTAWSVTGRAAWGFTIGPLELGPALEVGVERLALSVTPVIFAGPAPRTSAARVGALARAGLVLRGPLAGRIGWRVDAALQLRTAATEVSLPADFPARGAPLRVARWGPALGAAVEADLF